MSDRLERLRTRLDDELRGRLARIQARAVGLDGPAALAIIELADEADRLVDELVELATTTTGIRRKDAMARLLAAEPRFRPDWDAYQAGWAEAPVRPGVCGDLGAFSDFVDRCVRSGEAIDLPAIFAAIETLVAEGDPAVSTAATTCFLENLQNRETPAAAWVPLLGPESAAYCRAWDAFTGVKTPGL